MKNPSCDRVFFVDLVDLHEFTLKIAPLWHRIYRPTANLTCHVLGKKIVSKETENAWNLLTILMESYL